MYRFGLPIPVVAQQLIERRRVRGSLIAIRVRAALGRKFEEDSAATQTCREEPSAKSASVVVSLPRRPEPPRPSTRDTRQQRPKK